MDAVAVISDIHGNRLALEAVLEDAARQGIATIRCLGDLVGYGPDPNGVVDLIREANIPTLLGNYDDGIGRDAGDCGCYYPTAEARRLGSVSYAFTATQVTPERKAFLRDLPRDLHIDLGSARVHLVHGSPRKINEYLMKDRSETTFLRIAGAETDDALVFGHTHQQWHQDYGGVLFVGAGSVGKPKDGDARAAYTVVRSRGGGGRLIEVEQVRVAYDIEATALAMLSAGLPRELMDALRTGS